MKKAVVVEIKDNFAAVLSDDAIVSKVRNEDYSLGDKIELTEDMLVSNTETGGVKERVRKNNYFIGIAASFIILFITAFGLIGYNMPATYVSLDVNPSLEYSVNIFGKVNGVNAVNKDAEKLLSQIGEDSIKDKSIKDAVSITIKAMKDDNYLSSSKENNILISTTNNTPFQSSSLGAELKTFSANVCEENNLTTTVESVSVSKEEYNQAKELGVSVGKYYLYEQVKEKDENLSLEEYMNFSLEEMMSDEIDSTNDGSEGSDADENNPDDTEDDGSQADPPGSGSETSKEDEALKDNKPDVKK